MKKINRFRTLNSAFLAHQGKLCSFTAAAVGHLLARSYLFQPKLFCCAGCPHSPFERFDAWVNHMDGFCHAYVCKAKEHGCSLRTH
jgi:hypothetical protein